MSKQMHPKENEQHPHSVIVLVRYHPPEVIRLWPIHGYSCDQTDRVEDEPQPNPACHQPYVQTIGYPFTAESGLTVEPRQSPANISDVMDIQHDDSRYHQATQGTKYDQREGYKVVQQVLIELFVPDDYQLA